MDEVLSSINYGLDKLKTLAFYGVITHFGRSVSLPNEDTLALSLQLKPSHLRYSHCTMRPSKGKNLFT